MLLKVAYYGEHNQFNVLYRLGSTDENVMKEVLVVRTYRKPSAGFDIESGERWLDLGANIGTFAVYCQMKGAVAECYEPEPECFKLLKRNAKGFKCVQAAVSHRQEEFVSLWSSNRSGNYYRGTLLDSAKRSMQPEAIEVANVYAGSLGEFDGVKMDIEGSEFGLLDNNLVPKCNKLCFEYHTSRDKSMANLARRLEKLKTIFTTVAYAPELDRLMALGGMQKSFHDCVIYCIGRKKGK